MHEEYKISKTYT